MTVFYLIRHCTNNTVGRILAGRSPGIVLNDAGIHQAQRLADSLAQAELQAFYSSPLERCRQTAAVIAGRYAADVAVDARLIELDYGDWTGRRIDDLAGDSLWKQYNSFRSGTRIPGGEMMAEVQARMTGCLQELHKKNPCGSIGIITHGDPIKCVLAWYGGFSIDHMLRFEVSPASVSMVRLEQGFATIMCINRLPGDMP